MSFAILGLGTAVPNTAVNQEEGQKAARTLSCRTAEQVTWLRSIYENAGVQTRHLVLGAEVVQDFVQGTRHSGSVFLPSGTPDDLGPTTAQRVQQYAADAGPLALRAARQALEKSGCGPAEITHLVTVSCTGFRAPGVDVELIQGLGLPAGTQRTHVGYMGCHGALNGLRVARAFTGADPDARVLLCAVELCSLHYFYQWEPQRIIANALFADGAAAVVGRRRLGRPGRRLAGVRFRLVPVPQVDRRHDLDGGRPWLRDDARPARPRPDRRQPAAVADLVAGPARPHACRGRLLGDSPRRTEDHRRGGRDAGAAARPDAGRACSLLRERQHVVPDRAVHHRPSAQPSRPVRASPSASAPV